MFKAQLQFLRDIHAKSLRAESAKARREEVIEKVLPPVPHDAFETQLLALVTETGALRNASAAEAMCGLILQGGGLSVMHQCVVLEVLSRSRTSSLLTPFILRGGLTTAMKWGTSNTELLPLLLHWLTLLVRGSLVGQKSQRSIFEWLQSISPSSDISTTRQALLAALKQSLGSEHGATSNSAEKKRPHSSLVDSSSFSTSAKKRAPITAPSPSLASIALHRKPAHVAPSSNKSSSSGSVSSSSSAASGMKNVLDRFLDNMSASPSPPAAPPVKPSALPPAHVIPLGRHVSAPKPAPLPPPSATTPCGPSADAAPEKEKEIEEDFGSFSSVASPCALNRRIRWADEVEGGSLVTVKEFASDPEERVAGTLLPTDISEESSVLLIDAAQNHNYQTLRKKEHEGERIGFLRFQQRQEEERLQAAMRVAAQMRTHTAWNHSPPLIYLSHDVAPASVDTKERRLQAQRISRRSETIYSLDVDIPPNPENPTEFNPMIDMRSVGSSGIITIPFHNEEEVEEAMQVHSGEQEPHGEREETEQDGANWLDALPPYIMVRWLNVRY